MICYYLVVVVYLGACNSQSHQEKIRSTSKEVISAIIKNDAHKFESILGRQNKTFEMIEYDVNRLNSLFNKYSINNNSEVIITNLYNDLGQQLIRVPISGRDSTIPGLCLNLYFGPPQVMPLNKISGYEIIDGGKDPYEFRAITR